MDAWPNLHRDRSLNMMCAALRDAKRRIMVGNGSTTTVVETLDYFPYGALRIKTGHDVSQREFIGQVYDEASNLSYLNARYYDKTRGQFLSQDPVFWSNLQILSDPQSLHSYSYANNNPLRNSDPSGKAVYAVAKAIEANSLGTHVFLVLQPDNLPDFANSGLPIQKSPTPCSPPVPTTSHPSMTDCAPTNEWERKRVRGTDGTPQ